MKLNKIYAKLYTIFTGKPCIKILEKNGLKVGKNLNVQNGSIIDISHCFLISIGDNCTLAPNCHILAHDASTKNFIGYTKIGKVNIGNNVFIRAGAIILPNVKIGNNVIIGANSVVSKNIDSDCAIAGNPAKVISSLTEYLDKYKSIPEDIRFDESYTINKINDEKKKILLEKIEGNYGLIK